MCKVCLAVMVLHKLYLSTTQCVTVISYTYMFPFPLRTLHLKFYHEALRSHLVLKIIKGTFLEAYKK